MIYFSIKGLGEGMKIFPVCFEQRERDVEKSIAEIEVRRP